MNVLKHIQLENMNQGFCYCWILRTAASHITLVYCLLNHFIMQPCFQRGEGQATRRAIFPTQWCVSSSDKHSGEGRIQVKKTA